MTDSDDLSIPELAKIYDKSCRTIRRWVKLHGVPSFKLGNKTYVSRSDLTKFKHPVTK